jgi:hypothetical protein
MIIFYPTPEPLAAGLRCGAMTLLVETRSLNGQLAWRCRCDCGHEFIRPNFDIRRGLRNGANQQCRDCTLRSKDGLPRIVRRRPIRRSAIEGRIPKHVCGRCGSMPWRVIGDKCWSCDLARAEEKMPTALECTDGKGDSMRSHALPSGG